MTHVTSTADGEAAALLAPYGGGEGLREDMRRLRENREYLDAHRERLTAAFPDEWVCIVARRVVAHAGSPEEAMRLLGESGEPRGGALLRRLPTEQRVWLL